LKHIEAEAIGGWILELVQRQQKWHRWKDVIRGEVLKSLPAAGKGLRAAISVP
jgi:hypothetical protein